MASNMGNSIMLRNSEDWESFWFALEGIAGSSDTSVFKFIDVYDNANLLKSPELPKIPKAPDLPERPEVTLERNEVQTNQLYTTLLTEHRFLHAAYLEEKTKISKQLERYDALSGWVRQHVHPDNFIYMRNEQTLFKQLLALKKQFAPTDRARELRVTRLYNDALVYGDNEPVIRWLDNYQHVYEKAKEVNLPEITGYRAHYDFINAIKSIDAEYSKYLSIQLEKKRKKNKVPYLTEIIEDFRNHQRQEQESVETDRDFRNKTRAVAATFKEDFELRSNEHSEKNKQKYNEKECLCGSIHAWVKCFYLNPSLRTTTWKGKKEVYEKINKLLKNPKLKWVIKKYGYDGFKNEKTEETDHNIPNTGAVNFRSGNQKAAAVLTTRQSISISEESLWSQHVFSLNKKDERQFDDNFHLSNKWIIDNGADTHVANSTRNFEETKKANEGEVLYAGKGAYLIESYGNVVLPLKSDVTGEYLLLKDVAYVPGFMTNCVSLDKLTKANIHWNSRNPSILEREGDSSPFCYLFQSGSHWVFDEPEPNTVMSSSKRKSMKKRINKMTAAKAHLIMGHAGYDTINKIQDNCEGIEIDMTVPCPRTTECQTCACAKAHEIISRRQDVEFPAPPSANFYRTNQDIIPFEPSYNGHNYATHTQCDTSRYAILDTHRGKSAACQISINQIKMIEKQFDVSIRVVKTDGETVFNSREWVEFIAGRGIVRQVSSPDTSEQNGKSEAAGKVIVIISRALILASGLPNTLFSEALKCATYIYNRLPRKFLGWKSPFEIVTGRKPDLSHLHPLGCRAYVFQHNIPRLKKMLPRALIGYLVGYDSRNIFRVWIPSREKVIRSRDVVFNDNLFYDPSEIDLGIFEDEETVDFLAGIEIPNDESGEYVDEMEEWDYVPNIGENLDDSDRQFSPETNTAKELDTSEKVIASGNTDGENKLPTPSATPSPLRRAVDYNSCTDPNIVESKINESRINVDKSLPKSWVEAVDHESPTLLASKAGSSAEIDTNNILQGKRQRNKRTVQVVASEGSYKSFHVAFAASKTMVKSLGLHISALPTPPKNYKEMLKHEYTVGFKAAQAKEMNKLIEMEAVKFVKLSEIRDCNIEQLDRPLPLMWVYSYKLDPDGYLLSFKARIVARGDLQSTEEDTYAATATAYATRAVAAIIGAHGLKALQYDAVNAYGNSRRKIPLYTKCPPGFEDRGDGLLIFFGMYGLKPSALDWYNTYKSAALEIGLSVVPDSPCIFQNDWLIMIVYVDDILIAYHPHHEDRFREFELKFLQIFEFRKLGKVEHFIGIRFVRDESERKLWLVQDVFISKLEQKFKVNTQTKHRTPLPSGSLKAYDGIATPSQVHHYQQKTGSLNWLAVQTRPDIAWSVSELSRYLQNPGPEHMAAVDHLLEYISSTKYLALQFDGDTPPNICIGYSDASFADEIPSRHSSHGYAFSLYGGLITWKAQKQRTVTTSTTESELLALSQAGRELIWWKRFFKSIGFHLDEDITLYCDNRQALRVVSSDNSKLDTKLRHVDIHQMWIRQEIQNGRVKVEWIGTDYMLADGFTKALSHSRHEKFVKMTGLRDIKIHLNHDGPAPIDQE